MSGELGPEWFQCLAEDDAEAKAMHELHRLRASAAAEIAKEKNDAANSLEAGSLMDGVDVPDGLSGLDGFK